MLAQLRRSWPYAAALAVAQLVVPWLGALIVGDRDVALKSLWLTTLLLVNPVLALVAGALVGHRNGPDWLFVALAALAFVPAALLVYNDSALIYAVAYGACAALGVGAGLLLRRASRAHPRAAGSTSG